MLFIGTFFAFKKNAPQNKQIKKILINRCDRLGDAIISIPIIHNLEKKYDVTVITSTYNDFLFKKAGIKTIPLTNNLQDQNNETLIQKFRRYISPFKISLNASDFDAYLNFSGTNLVKFEGNSHNLITVGFKFGISPLFYDYVVPSFHTQSYTQCLIDMIKIIDSSFFYSPEPEDLSTLKSDHNHLDNILPDQPFILFHIGGKYARLLDDNVIVDLLNSLPYKTLVVDSPDQNTLNKIKDKISNSLIQVINNNFDLFELFSITSSKLCKLFIGYDSGSSHLLQWNSNALIIFTTGDHKAWRPFTGNDWIKININTDCTFEYSNITNFKKSIIYKPLKCRPCYDIMCPSKKCKSMKLDWKTIEEYFQDIIRE